MNVSRYNRFFPGEDPRNPLPKTPWSAAPLKSNPGYNTVYRVPESLKVDYDHINTTIRGGSWSRGQSSVKRL